MRIKFTAIFCFCFFLAHAQNKGSWQIILETNGMKANNEHYDFFYSSYTLLDSANSLFKRYERNLATEVKSKFKPAIYCGVRYSYQINDLLKIHLGVLLGNVSVERNIALEIITQDSSTITLQGSGPNWFDPSNGNTVVLASSPTLGTLSGTGGVYVRNFPNYNSKYRGNGVEKIKLTSIETPFGLSISPDKTNFTFTAEISPVFVIKSSAVIKYEPVPEITYPIQPEYKAANTDINWKLGAGISYQLNKPLSIGINYRQYIHSVAAYNDIKLRGLGLQLIYSLSFKK